MLNKYAPSELESKHYQNWEAKGYFSADFSKPESFSIQLPPPNVTGTLHGSIGRNPAQILCPRELRAFCLPPAVGGKAGAGVGNGRRGFS